MIVRNEFQQNSLEWLVARAGIPTASEFDNLVTPDFKLRTGEMPKTYLAAKIGEAWLGGPLPGSMTLDMEFGKILEEEALPGYEFQTGERIARVGLITTDDGRIGCSPDGLIGDDGGIEVKCPAIKTAVKYLLNGELPKDYAAQVHGGMLVTGRKWWRFVCYCRNFPSLILTVQRDEEIQSKLSEALQKFLADFDVAWKRMVEINGGPPPPRPVPVLTSGPIKFSWEQSAEREDDLIP